MKDTISVTPNASYPPSSMGKLISDKRNQTTSRAEIPQQRQENRETSHEGVIAQQPRGGKIMSTRNAEEMDSPMRLRGGCIPCPGGGTCWIIPIPCCF